MRNDMLVVVLSLSVSIGLCACGSTNNQNPNPGKSADAGSPDGGPGAGDDTGKSSVSRAPLDWSSMIASSETDVPHGITIGSNGKLYLTGDTDGDIAASTGEGSTDAFIVRRSAQGKPEWSFILGTNEVDQAWEVAAHPSGDIYMAASMGGSVENQDYGGGEWDAALARFDHEVGLYWVRLIGTGGWDLGHGVAVDDNGDIYLAGNVGGSVAGRNYRGGPQDGFVAKFNERGERQWTRLIGSSGEDGLASVTAGSNGNIYVTGAAGDDIENETHAGGESDVLVASFDASGNRRWMRVLGSGDNEIANELVVDGSDNLYITGATSGNLEGQSFTGEGDAGFVAKLKASSGNLQWMRLYKESVDHHAQGIAVDGAGAVYSAGGIAPTTKSHTDADQPGLFDGSLVKFGASGQREWLKRIGTDGFDSLSDVHVRDSGEVVVTGWTDRAFGTEFNSGGFDGFVAGVQ